jgi:predicted Ser/Thr protein kinase
LVLLSLVGLGSFQVAAGNNELSCNAEFEKDTDLYARFGVSKPDEDEYDPVIKDRILLLRTDSCYWCQEHMKENGLHPFVSPETGLKCGPGKSQEKDCPTVPEFVPLFGKLAGSGTFGFVYTGCTREIKTCRVLDACCPYAVKIQLSVNTPDKAWDFRSDVPQNSFMTEVKLQTIASSYKLAQRVYNAWSCNLPTAHSNFVSKGHDFLVMQKYGDTLSNYQILGKLSEKMEDEIIEKIELLHHKARIFHGDLHTKNIMINEAESRWGIIDFGKSKSMDEEGSLSNLSEMVFDYHNLYITSSIRSPFFKIKIWHRVMEIAKSNIQKRLNHGDVVINGGSFKFLFPKILVKNTSRADLNGKSGVLIDFNPSNGRFIVRVGGSEYALNRDKIFRELE